MFQRFCNSFVKFVFLFFLNTIKTQLKWQATKTGTLVIKAMPQYSEKPLLTRLVEHAAVSEFGPIKAFSYSRVNLLVTFSGNLKTPLYTGTPVVQIYSNMPIKHVSICPSKRIIVKLMTCFVWPGFFSSIRAFPYRTRFA